MSVAEISRVLTRQGRREFNRPFSPVRFSGKKAADRLINDLERRPHAFVIGCIMDRQILAERAWIIPYELSKRVGGFAFPRLRRLSLMQCKRAMARPTRLHRFSADMGLNLYEGIQLIQDLYDGDASRIWADRPTSSALILRFLGFRGVGPKIATMAANILARNFRVPLENYYSIDISPDVHVRRVFRRLGLVREGASTEEVVYAARDISPRFPGLVDFPVWRIGKDFCRPREPHCDACSLQRVCEFAGRTSPQLPNKP